MYGAHHNHHRHGQAGHRHNGFNFPMNAMNAFARGEHRREDYYPTVPSYQTGTQYGSTFSPSTGYSTNNGFDVPSVSTGNSFDMPSFSTGNSFDMPSFSTGNGFDMPSFSGGTGFF
jgi:hypothetical protein